MMEITQIWIVSKSSGSYEEYQIEPVIAFEDKGEAEEWIKINQKLFLENQRIAEDQAYEYRSLISDAIEDFEIKFGVTGIKITGDLDEELYQIKKKITTDWIAQGKATSSGYDEHGYSLNDCPITFIKK